MSHQPDDVTAILRDIEQVTSTAQKKATSLLFRGCLLCAFLLATGAGLITAAILASLKLFGVI